ncbi:MAG: hypothetical protein ACREBJ_01640 [Nitrosotalea sp.]
MEGLKMDQSFKLKRQKHKPVVLNKQVKKYYDGRKIKSLCYKHPHECALYWDRFNNLEKKDILNLIPSLKDKVRAGIYVCGEPSCDTVGFYKDEQGY